MYLKNIEKIFRLIPTTFILISSIVAIIITYLLLQLQEQREIDLLKQKKILEDKFNKKEILQTFNIDLQNQIDQNVANIEQNLREHTFKIIGGLKHHFEKSNSKTVQECLEEYEKENDVFVVVIEESNLEVLYGKDKIVFLAELIFGAADQKHKKLVSQYIASQGRYNLQEWRNDLVGTLKLSFFDNLFFEGKNYYVGTFSKTVDIRVITKNILQQKIKTKNKNLEYYIWFYDLIDGDTYNFNNDGLVLPMGKTLHLFKEQLKEEFLNLSSADQQIKEFDTHFILHDRKNKLSIAINTVNGIEIDQSSIEQKYRYLFLKYAVIIALVTLFLVIFTRHLALFIKVQLDARELKQQVEEELEKNRQKDRILIQQSKLAGMGEMLGNIAHQWRQPLNNVSLFLQFIQSHYQDERTERNMIEKYFHKAFTQINYMSQTIDDFRNFYKPSKQKSNFNIKEAVDSAIDIISVQLKDGNIRLILHIDDIMIYSFENELKQSLLNILSNAHQAIVKKKKYSTFKPYIKIDIKETIDKITIVISNNGGAIDEEILPKIFEPYFTTKFESQGTGVGLYMTKSIVEVNLKGKIEVENFDNGVSFQITLPKGKKE